MEYLPTTLSRCLDANGRFPEETNYSIFRDVTLGLNYLHQRPASIIHCNLTADNVMLTGSLRAKIVDFGDCEILEPGRDTDLTICPGTPVYMPPEAVVNPPHYDTKLDMFSYGVLMVHTLCAQCPLPTDSTHEDPSKPGVGIAVSEADLRAKYLDQIGRGHPLMDLILQCLSNNPGHRPTAVEALAQVTQRAESAGYSQQEVPIPRLMRDNQQSREECSRLEQELRQQREQSMRDNQQSQEECSRLEQELQQQREQSMRDNQQSRDECSWLQQELQQQREQSIRDNQQSRDECSRLEQELRQQREQSMRDNQQSRDECSWLQQELQQQREQSMRDNQQSQEECSRLEQELQQQREQSMRDNQQSQEECSRLEQELQQQREQSMRDNQQSREECSRLEGELQQQREQSMRDNQQSRDECSRLEGELQQQREQSIRDNQQSREEYSRLEQENRQRREQSMREQEEHQQQMDALQQRLDAALAEVQRTPQVVSRHQTSWNLPRQEVQVLGGIGSGAWGTVARGKFRGQSVAVKWPHPAILNDYTIERLRREVQIMAQVKHPNLLLFVGAVFDDQLPHQPPLIVTELLDMNLRMAYERGRLTGFSKVPIFQDVAYALHYLHEHQEPIIHRDVSSPNVLLQELPNGMFRAKVSDFGSANLVRLAQTAGEGAIVYTAPETLPQTRDIHSPPPPQTAKMDVYSYGILLCEVITSQFPDPDKLWSMLQQVQRQWPFMYELIVTCTKRSPDERPTMAEVLDKLNKLPRPRPQHQT